MVFMDAGNYILLMGGLNIESEEVYDDAYIYYEKKWLKLCNMQMREGQIVGAQAVRCGERLFLFGGEICEGGVTRVN
jgi:N-acetylneuraminic acid mutarotase